MKASFLKLSAALFAALFCVSCGESKNDNAPKSNLVESSNLIGLWQRLQSVEVVDEETGLEVTTLVPENFYKLIMNDGTYVIYESIADAEGTPNTRIIHYGDFTLVGDTIEIEHVEISPTYPQLTGHDCTVRYQLSDVNTLSAFYKFNEDDGSLVSTEWSPEVFKRVTFE